MYKLGVKCCANFTYLIKLCTFKFVFYKRLVNVDFRFPIGVRKVYINLFLLKLNFFMLQVSTK